ncbi:hypothetical protein ATO10_07146 [Actibacterium atlanticum]|uniref:Uncharacterized protein n=1 Tax=Actibacterium atlanticum TaxID=1461693 RepID=A0A058ZNA5_9RHOB|nr:hypothetical protein [Actibacterium atlanticum]KCV82700.1 hypothetical protein ATO10_07146 [Actibacterium atlanticum]
MIESPVPSTYLARVVVSEFDSACARHVAQLQLTACSNVTMMVTCHSDLPQSTETTRLHSELLADASRQLSRLPEHRRRAPPQLIYDDSAQG